MNNSIYKNMFQKKITGENKQKVDNSDDVLLKAYQQCITNSTQNSTIKPLVSNQECMRRFLEKSST